MKVLFIDVNYKDSSTGNIVYNLHLKCRENNIESAVCYGRGKKYKEDGVFKFGLDIETYFHALLTRLTGYTGRYSYFSTKRLIKYIKKFKPDIIHIHELHAYFVNIKQLLMFLRDNHIKTVFTNHCEFLYTGKCGHAGECKKYSIECGACPHLKEYPKTIFIDKTKSMLLEKKSIFDGWNDIVIVSASSWLNSRMNISFLKSKKRVVINNSINTEIFNFNESKYNPKEKIILSIAPNIFSDLKGGYRILDIAKKMPEYKFVLVGSDNLMKSDLPNVEIFSKIQDKSLLRDKYSSAFCFLLLSKTETFPTTSIEAQCCGLQVIGYDVGGVKETILDGNGVVVPYLDDNAVIKSIKEILNSNYDKKEVSRIAREHYSNDKMFEKYLEIYKDLCH